jgi:UDP:flavonoid glycosyltransferase YjiC (YdhE family)
VSALIATAGRADLRDIPPNVFLASYLPGEAAAGRSQLVICNGGSPTCYQALKAGVPVIGIASNLDQYLNMHYLESAGVAMLLRAGKLTAHGLKRAVESAIAEPAYRSRAAAVRDAIMEHDFRRLFPALVDRVLART